MYWDHLPHVTEEMLRRDAELKLRQPLCEMCGINSQMLLFGTPVVSMPSGKRVCNECLAKGE